MATGSVAVVAAAQRQQEQQQWQRHQRHHAAAAVAAISFFNPYITVHSYFRWPQQPSTGASPGLYSPIVLTYDAMSAPLLSVSATSANTPVSPFPPSTLLYLLHLRCQHQCPCPSPFAPPPVSAPINSSSSPSSSPSQRLFLCYLS